MTKLLGSALNDGLYMGNLNVLFDPSRGADGWRVEHLSTSTGEHKVDERIVGEMGEDDPGILIELIVQNNSDAKGGVSLKCKVSGANSHRSPEKWAFDRIGRRPDKDVSNRSPNKIDFLEHGLDREEAWPKVMPVSFDVDNPWDGSWIRVRVIWEDVRYYLYIDAPQALNRKNTNYNYFNSYGLNFKGVYLFGGVYGGRTAHILSDTGRTLQGNDESSVDTKTDFGSVSVGENSDELRLWLRNFGSEVVDIQDLRLVNDDADQFKIVRKTKEDFVRGLNDYSRDTEYVEVEFRPTSPGTKTCSLQWTTDISDRRFVGCTLKGTGVA